MECSKVPHAKKAKKKQVKDELDRMKQAEKKRRRLEKALATSAAIRSELEKKKQMKKEEQQRLDEEGAAIAEAVALHVLIGEDSDDSCKILVEKDDEFDPWHGCAFETIREIPNSYDSCGYNCNEFRYGGRSVPSRPSESFPLPYLQAASWVPSGVSAGLVAAQAVSALHLGDVDADTVFFNRFR